MTEPTTGHGLTRTLAIELVRRYAAAVSAGDADALAAMFSLDATQQDPIDAPIKRGRAEIHAAFAGALPTDGTRLQFTAGPVRGGHATIAFQFDFSATTKDGAVSTISGIDVFAVNDDLLIEAAVGYWGADDIGQA